MGENVVDYDKKSILEAMYKSVERMNRHITEGNQEAVISEQHLQMNLRGNFRALQGS